MSRVLGLWFQEGGAVAQRADPGDFGHVVDGAREQGALRFGVEAGVEFVDPAMDAELVVAGGLDDANLVGVEDEADGGDEERGRDALAVEEVDDAGKRDAGAVLSL